MKKTRQSRRENEKGLIIIGGGMVGLTLACALKDTGLKITVVERTEAEPRMSLKRDCRVSAIVAGTVGILGGIGVWPYVKDKAGSIDSMRIWDNQRFGSIRFEAEEAGLDTLGYIVENSILLSAMLEVVHASENIEWCCPASVESVQWKASCVEVSLDDGRVLTTPLIVGADGGRSWLRSQAHIPTWSHRFEQQGIVATIQPQLSHRNCAYQRFLPTGPLAFLPLTDGLCSIVWSAQDTEADRLMALSDVAFLNELQLALGPVMGKLEQAGARAAFPLRSQLSRHIVRPRMALIGDAAHQVHPLAGLGVNLGIRDAMVLAQEIVDARHFEEDYGSLDVLNRFMHSRMPDILAVMGGMEAFNYLFTHDVPGLALLRDAGMRVVGNSGPVKRMLMRRAMGLTLPVPKQVS
ncbi:MAG: UbiH/UbiF/VisC/COQ6 family ubiquinone biosynthesis hydroxylase [Mariprofundaceae bacterium]|nr:UbiH/UbiF/VisC/COQ6 family ubiquinone biosynthesis hydroxylase [Mariprofundaceae bacterium]